MAPSLFVSLRTVLVIGLRAVVIIGLRAVVNVGLCAIVFVGHRDVVSCRLSKPPRAREVLPKFLTYSFMFLLLQEKSLSEVPRRTPIVFMSLPALRRLDTASPRHCPASLTPPAP
jgi:hypothetical protein